MPRWLRNPAVAGILLLCGVFGLVCNLRRPRVSAPPPEITSQLRVDYVCEECDARFVAQLASMPIECPKCGKKAAVQSLLYRCVKCGKRFEQSRKRCVGKSDGMSYSAMWKPMPGGDWQDHPSGAIQCPGCGNQAPRSFARVVPDLTGGSK